MQVVANMHVYQLGPFDVSCSPPKYSSKPYSSKMYNRQLSTVPSYAESGITTVWRSFKG